MSELRLINKTGVEMIAEERRRQMEVEGYTLEHDSHHVDCDLAFLACYYAMPCMMIRRDVSGNRFVIRPDEFLKEVDFQVECRHKHDRLRQLTIAGALIAAEIDRLSVEYTGI